MKIMDILVRESVVVELESTTKDGVLAELTDAVSKARPDLDRGRLLTVLREREALQSTGIGEGVAIPHGKLPGIDGMVASFGRSTGGVDFDSIDGEPTRLFFLLVVPEHSGGQHLKALARISRFCRDASFREEMMRAQFPEDIFRALEEEDGRF